jgi:glutathione S-transferase
MYGVQFINNTGNAMLELWELGGRNDVRFSTFSWRSRMALHHKGVDFRVRPVAVSDKRAIAFSGQTKVPILKAEDRVVCDSWDIAIFLEREFPDRPSLFGGPVGEQLTYFFNQWTDREIVPALVPYLMRDVLDCVDEPDRQHLRNQIEGFFKKSLEDLYTEREKALAQLGKKLSPVRKMLARAPFLGGETPAYADYILFGTLQWARVVSDAQVLPPSDVISDWFSRMLDLFGGVGRKERARAERKLEAAE